MPNSGKSLGRHALLLAMPILALVIFGFISLSWEKRAHEEELRTRCLALAAPLRREFFSRLAEFDYLRETTPSGDFDSLPSPGGESDSLALFQNEKYQSVLGEAEALSESGLPLRPLAAIRLIRTEEDPKRLEELTEVIAAEPNFISSQLLREAEERHRKLNLPLPDTLVGWEEKLKRATLVRQILNGRAPNDLLSAAQGFQKFDRDKELLFAIKTPKGPALVEESALGKVVAASLDSIAKALPGGIAAEMELNTPKPDQSQVIALAPGTPPIRFIVRDADSLNELSSRRRGFFVAFLMVASVLSGIGVFVLLRSVARERELAERKGNLVAAVSHEMRTPVASMRLLAENLSTGAADTTKRKNNHLKQLLEQSERLSTLVENVLSYSKRMAGRANWKLEAIDVSELLSNGAQQFETLAENREISLKWSSDKFSSPPKGDFNALAQALANLIDNALKHSPQGSELCFGAESNSNRPDEWCLWVSDCGPGVPREERKNIFEAFYRVGPELRRETKGTGLGLALVQQVAEAHGGEALCRESESGGARFELHLPLTPPTPNELKN